MANYQNEKIATIYIGGGTPSTLNIDQLRELFDIIAIFDKQEKCEITIEVNCDISREKLTFLKNKVTRISFGVQSFNDKMLKYLGRNHNGWQARKTILLAKQIGFSNINVDLMYGIEIQTLADLQKDIEIIKELGVEHVSFYSLIIKNNTAFALKKNVDDETEFAMYQLICQFLNEFEHYEISNFALKNFYSRHNVNYWLNNEYYGFGMGAVGYVNNIRYYNANNWRDYLKQIRKEEAVSDNERIQNEFILGLRQTSGISEKVFINRYKKSFLDYDVVQKLLNEEKLLFVNGYLKIAKDRLYLMNDVLVELMIDYE